MIMTMVLTVMAVYAQSEVNVYIADPSGTPTNVRSTPGGAVVATLSNDDGGIVVNLLEIRNNWWHIYPVVEFWGDDDHEITLTGSTTGYWVHRSVLGLGIAGDPTDALRAKPSWKARVVDIPSSTELSFRPVAMKGKWLKVISTDGRCTGWLHCDRICFNPLTTCP